MKRIRRTPRGNRCDKSLDSQGILLFVLKRGKIAISRQPLFKWTWRELNPRPKAHPPEHLPSQSLLYHSLRQTPNDRLPVSVAS